MLPADVLERVFSYLPLIDFVRSISVCKCWKQILLCPQFLQRYSVGVQINWVAVIDDYASITNEVNYDQGRISSDRFINIYDARLHKLQFALTFLPSKFSLPVAASGGILCVAGELNGRKTICLCNPLTKTYRILPALQDSLSRPVTLMITGPENESAKVLIISDDLLALYSSQDDHWVIYGSGIPLRPRSPIIASNGIIYGLEDVGSGWRRHWRLACCRLDGLGSRDIWNPVEKNEWGDIFDILEEPSLIRGRGDCLLLAGGLRSSLSLNSACSTFMILVLDLNSLEWNEAGRMPLDFFKHFDVGGGFKIFGGREGVYFSGKRLGRLVLWDFSDGRKGCWRWGDNFSGRNHVLCRGFPFEPRLDAVP
eukprot:Gb_12171 [translate_table: standard]